MWAKEGEEGRNHSWRHRECQSQTERPQRPHSWFSLGGETFAQGHGAGRENQVVLTPTPATRPQAESKAESAGIKKKKVM